MSQPKRYRPSVNNRKEVVMGEDVSGDWTSLTEYYKLHDRVVVLLADNAALKSENERLRIAGNAMYNAAVQDSMGLWVMPAFEQWSKIKNETK